MATSPARAALGFDASLRVANSHMQLKFACPDSEGGGYNTATLEGAQSRTARTIRVGDRWRVTVTVRARDSASSSSYEVRREGAGYCVWRQVNS
jgi:hypothetical protein